MVGAAAGQFELGFVPRLDSLAAVLDPGLGRFDRLADLNDFMHHARALGVVRTPRLAFGHLHQGGLHADQAGQALGAAAAGEQADLDFRQTQLDLRIVLDDAIVAGEGELETAAKRQTIDGCSHRLAAGFKLTEGTVQRPARIIGGLKVART